MELLTLFRRVRARVLASTDREQRPHEYQSLLGEHYLAGAPVLASAPARDPRLVETALGLDRAARRQVQQGLAAAGFSPGPVDAVFGPGTRAAIRRWQASRGAVATVYLDAAGARALGAPVAVAASAPAGGAVPGNVPATVEAQSVFWQSIEGSENPADYEAYLEQFPAGIYVRLARNRLAEMGAGIRPVASDPPLAARPRAPGTVFRDCATCPELVVVPAGRSHMGCVSGRDCQSDERPVHEVEVSSFALGVYEVTFEEYDRFVQATGHRRPNDYGWGRGGRPVMDVSWKDAAVYVAWLSRETGESYRLPSESEWEYAARAGTTTGYSWGEYIRRNRANCDDCEISSDSDQTAPAGSFAANGWGLHDMLGNVWEWVADCWHEDYAGARRLGVDAWRGLWSPCVSRRFLERPFGGPAFGESQEQSGRRSELRSRFSCGEDARLALASDPTHRFRVVSTLRCRSRFSQGRIGRARVRPGPVMVSQGRRMSAAASRPAPVLVPARGHGRRPSVCRRPVSPNSGGGGWEAL